MIALDLSGWLTLEVYRTLLVFSRISAAFLLLPGFGEPDVPRARTAAALVGELESMAAWLGLGGISLSGRGDLATELRAAAKRAS